MTCKFFQLNHLAYPILHFAKDVFFQIFSGAEGCPQMPLTLRRDVNPSSFENYSSTPHLFRFGNKPTFLRVWVVSQIRPGFSQFVPPLLYRFQRSGTTCVTGIPALFCDAQDTQACNQGLKADGVNCHRQGIPLCCAFGGFELTSSCYKQSRRLLVRIDCAGCYGWTQNPYIVKRSSSV